MIRSEKYFTEKSKRYKTCSSVDVSEKTLKINIIGWGTDIGTCLTYLLSTETPEFKTKIAVSGYDDDDASLSKRCQELNLSMSEKLSDKLMGYIPSKYPDLSVISDNEIVLVLTDQKFFKHPRIFYLKDIVCKYNNEILNIKNGYFCMFKERPYMDITITGKVNYNMYMAKILFDLINTTDFINRCKTYTVELYTPVETEYKSPEFLLDYFFTEKNISVLEYIKDIFSNKIDGK